MSASRDQESVDGSYASTAEESDDPISPPGTRILPVIATAGISDLASDIRSNCRHADTGAVVVVVVGALVVEGTDEVVVAAGSVEDGATEDVLAGGAEVDEAVVDTGSFAVGEHATAATSKTGSKRRTTGDSTSGRR